MTAIAVIPGVPAAGTTGQVLAKNSGADYDTHWVAAGSGSGSGTVTNVGLTAPAEFTVTGSPVTGAGTIAAAWASAAQHAVLAAPAGGAGTPAFRALVAGDVPDLSATYLTGAGNLAGVASAATARTNLGLGSAATHPSTDFQAAGSYQPAGSYLVTTSNLSDLGSAPTARTNLGLGSSATHSSTDFLLTANNLSDVTAATARTNLGLGTAATAAAASFAPALAPTAVKTANYSAAAGDFVPADVSGGSWTLTLPTAPADGARAGAKAIATAGTNTLTISCGGSDAFNKAGGPTSATLALLNQAISLQYRATGALWYVVGDDLPLSQLDLRYAPLASPVFTGRATVPARVAAWNALPAPAAGTITINWSTGDAWSGTLPNTSVTFAYTNLPAAGVRQRLELRLTQPASGATCLVTWPSGSLYPSGIPPVLATTTGATDTVAVDLAPDGSHYDTALAVGKWS